MKQRLIDANKIEYENIYVYPTDDRNYKECVGKSAKIREAETVLTIPENPTNGDMIKALFPNAEISLLKSKFEKTKVAVTWNFSEIPSYYNLFYEDWWNSEYKESEAENEYNN